MSTPRYESAIDKIAKLENETPSGMKFKEELKKNQEEIARLKKSFESYDITHDYCEIISGTASTTAPLYTEAKKSLGTTGTNGLAKMKSFITSIEKIAAQKGAKDKRITDSKGNITTFVGYDNIKCVMDFIKEYLGSMKTFKDVTTLYDALHSYQSLYVEGYQKNVRIVILEYESIVYLVVTGLSMLMANNIDVISNNNKITIKKKAGRTIGVIDKTIHDMAKEVNASNHRDYLDKILKLSDHVPVNTSNISKDEPKKEDPKPEENKDENKDLEESVLMESVVEDSLKLIEVVYNATINVKNFSITAIKTIKSSLFGIVPLIKSVLYLKYKKKADTVAALEQQAGFIANNIKHLENNQSMDPAKRDKIVKKQQAKIEAYMKKAEKLRAQLIETEKDAATAIKQDNTNMRNTPSGSDDDFILEGMRIEDVFTEGKEEAEDTLDGSQQS